MKILWLCNVIPPVIANQLNIDTTVKEGWIDASLRRLLEDDQRDIIPGICVPSQELDAPYIKQKVTVNGKDILIYRFMEKTETPWVYDTTLEKVFSVVLNDFSPDIIHIFGTEYPHALACVRACEHKEKILVGLQGIMSVCAECYTGGLPDDVVNATTFRDWIKKDNIASQKRRFEIRAGFEREVLLKISHVTGRTAFDKTEVLKINPKLTYHHMDETLRPEFYKGEWNSDSLDKHTVFVSQADYPLKGFHVLLEAMPRILQHYPDAHIYVAGNSITGYSSLKEKIKIGTYGKYLRDTMNRLGISDKITVLGRLTAEDMRNRYENSGVYVCTSYVENSPNSLGEAMLTGTPSVVPETGGIPSVTSTKESVFYPVGDSIQLAESITGIFSDKEKAKVMSEESRKRAGRTHDAEKNFKRLLEIYDTICQG